MQLSLRHLRMFQALARSGSVTRAAGACHVSQPAVTQAIRRLESQLGHALVQRSAQGMFPTDAGALLLRRVDRALGFLDAATADMDRRLRHQATRPQLVALIAVTETESFTLAARRLGLAQPTVHRSATQLEGVAGTALFQRTAHGMIATRTAEALSQAARLCFAELDQAEAELAALAGRETGRIVIGALPLARSGFLPDVLIAFWQRHPGLPVQVVDGRYDELLLALRRGELDLMIGALRQPAPVAGIEQERLFDDTVVLVARRGHPLTAHGEVGRADLLACPWVIARQPTPIRTVVDGYLGEDRPSGVIETSSLITLREIVTRSDFIGAVSRMQALAAPEAAALSILPVTLPNAQRPIGLTTRAGWEPTPAQAALIDICRAQSAALG